MHRSIKAIAPFLAAVLSCTAYVDQPRPNPGADGVGRVEVASSAQLPFTAQVGSLGTDRFGNAGYTEEAGWMLVSVGRDGEEVFRASLQRPRQMILPGGGDGWRLLNVLDRRIVLYDRNGGLVSEIGYDGLSAWTGAVSPGGDIYLLDADRLEVRVYDRGGGMLQSIRLEAPDGQFRPNCLAAEPSLNLMAAGDPGRGMVVVYNLYGAIQGTIQIQPGGHRQALSLDYLGRLWGCRPQAGAVSIYGLRGGSWALLQELPLDRPYAVAMSPFGSGIVAEPGRLSFVRF